ncbi:ribosomal protein L7/L12 [Xylanimonas sp. McL0601]|uniref:ribosomal protein L7/L12 n=1 Tax=Xylanimonas sp. McL0601 TaxID=3414739 RepID=UPI003CEBBEC9
MTIARRLLLLTAASAVLLVASPRPDGDTWWRWVLWYIAIVALESSIRPRAASRGVSDERVRVLDEGALDRTGVLALFDPRPAPLVAALARAERWTAGSKLPGWTLASGLTPSEARRAHAYLRLRGVRATSGPDESLRNLRTAAGAAAKILALGLTAVVVDGSLWGLDGIPLAVVALVAWVGCVMLLHRVVVDGMRRVRWVPQVSDDVLAAAEGHPVADLPLRPGIALVLVDPGDSPIHTIKEVRALTGLGLREAKDLVDRTSTGPSVVVDGLDDDAASDALRALLRAGARASVHRV